MRRRPQLLLAGLLLAAAGCAHSTTPPPQAALGEYRLGPEDVVTVDVWKEPALSAKVPVRPDGKITLPMVGEVDASGHTTAELQKEITKRLAPAVNDPQVAVMVSQVNSAKFYVVGEVAHPGSFPVRGIVDVVQAVALAGGPTEFASPRSTVVIRKDPLTGKESRYRVNYSAVLEGKAPAIDLVSGDTVFVP